MKIIVETIKGIVSQDFEECFWYRWIAQTLLPLTERVLVKFLIFWALALVVFAVSESRLRERHATLIHLFKKN
jgi:hypothetical protein